METLRERESSLRSSSHEHECVPRDNEATNKAVPTGDLREGLPHDFDGKVKDRSDVEPDEAVYGTFAHCPQGEEYAADRFGPHYVHPHFPCKTVQYSTAKRTFDLAFAGLLLLFLWPLILIAALLVRLTSRGPVIFRQVRVGRGGRYFTCYKLRSMCVDAEEKRRALEHLNELDGPVFKIKRDPRITPVGAVIRKLSIDELPQLINVIRGDMSIVGPRPPVPDEVENYSERERGRLTVQPGLTCLWQVSGRSNLPFDRWMELDLEYIETMSFANDVKIVARTIPAVISGSGAH